MFNLTTEEQAIVEKVLVQNPSPNIKPFSFYKSDMKTVAKMVEELRKIDSGNQDIKSQFVAALRSCDLINEGSAPYSLTALGTKILEIDAKMGKSTAPATQQGEDAEEDDDSQEKTDLIDGEIFAHLLKKLLSSDPQHRKPALDSFAKRLRNAQVFLSSVPLDKRSAVIDDRDLLLVLQSLNLEECEVKRYFRLSAAEQRTFRAAWDKARKAVPESSPDTFPGKMYFTYFSQVRTSGSRNLQLNARPRLQAFLRAYVAKELELGDRFPTLDDQARIKDTAAANARHTVLTPSQGTFDGPRQLLVMGCPGSGKSYYIEKQAQAGSFHKLRTIFHSETSYFDFVGSYKPTPVYEDTSVAIRDRNLEEFKLGKPLIDYTFVPGPFTLALLDAVNNPETRVMLVIEEINRANCAAVFGDILQLLDRGDDGVSEYGISPNPDLSAFLRRAGVDLTNGLHLPANLFIWATMNSADQGVFPLDSAFRRRWEYKHFGFQTTCNYGQTSLTYNMQPTAWDDLRSRINDKLLQIPGIHEDKLIGPYFLKQTEIQDSEKILHKLFHYLWDDVLRHQQGKLFNCTNLQQLSTTWNGGSGAPLNL
jgi:adenylate kinase family enzyme